MHFSQLVSNYIYTEYLQISVCPELDGVTATLCRPVSALPANILPQLAWKLNLRRAPELRPVPSAFVGYNGNSLPIRCYNPHASDVKNT